METTRKLASIMFTDIVGYSTLMQIDEERAAIIRARHKKIFQETHVKYGGTIVQYFGDGTLSIFDSNVNAVEAAVEMQIEFQKSPEVPLRIGIHSGDITLGKDEAYGTGLNIAARIEPICEPGGVFVSERVHDDIKNHNWLRAVSLGDFRLKNIFEPIHIFAISNTGISVPEEGRLPIQPLALTPKRSRPIRSNHIEDDYVSAVSSADPPIIGERNKVAAGFLSLFFGMFGVHRFYLGQRKLGIVYFLLTVVTIFLAAISNGHFIVVPFMAGLAFLDAMIFFFTPKGDFDLRYNSGMTRKEYKRMKKDRKRMPVQRRRAQTQSRPSRKRKRPEPYTAERPYAQARVRKQPKGDDLFKAGLQKYKAGRYTAAKEDFEKSLEKDYQNPNAHFMLACCFSVLKNSDQSFFHLSSAVDFGFDQFEEVYESEGLKYLRSLPEFDVFVENDYKIQAKLPEPKEGLLETKSYYDTTVLDKISDLGELMERGVINRDEFEVQKERLLGRN